MRHAIRPFVALLCLLLAAQAASAKDTWTSVRSQNFFLVGNASEKEIRGVAARLEEFREVFTQLFPGARHKSPVPTTVVVFKNDSSYKPFKPVVGGKVSEVAGYFQAGEDVNYITLTTERRRDDPFAVIYHEYVHLLVENTMGRSSVPPWFNEGLAEYYSTLRIEDGRKVYLGDLIENHIYHLREQRLIPLKQLFEVDNYSLHRNGHQARGLFYAESWALVHYLILGNEGRRLPQVGKFLQLLDQKKPTEEAFREAFQTDIASIEKELKDYIGRHTFAAKVATFSRKLEFDSGMQAAPLSDAEAEAYLGDLLLHTNRPEDAEARLKEAVRLDPKLASARASLGMAYVRQGRFEEAKEQLREAVAAGAQNYLAHYYYAYALSREGMNEYGLINTYPAEKAATMRAALKRAAELKPDFPESYRLLAFVNLVRGESLDESVKLLQRARALAPGNEHYALMLAQVYLRQEKFDEARRTVEPLTRPSADPSLRGPAQSLLNSINSMQEQMARYKSAAGPPRPVANDEDNAPRLQRRGEGVDDSTPSRLPPGKSVDEAVADALAEALNDALRKPEQGETRLRAVLTAIECGRKGLVFVFKADDQVLRLAAPNFEGLHIRAFTPEAGGEIGCGPRKRENVAVVTFRPAPDARAKTSGALVAVEFVPASFRLK
ncbi:MAG TPA: tetratricopeptide repeat protein [Pyrinomonadaceae bacterium]|jgi:tetratricopeptide (TPR) repeat protein|nr:tetratricopeptide repeat protein [Pyrinomonadaceae bacterium]